MFESDDYDEVLSQIDLKEVDPYRQIPSPKVPEHLRKNENGYKPAVLEIVPHVQPGLIDKNLSPKHNKRKFIDTHFHQNRRKFPGPAGLLSGTIGESKDDAMCEIELLSQDINTSQSHLNSEVFETPLWKRLIEDTSFFSCNTIKIIKQQALTGNLKRKKADIVRGFIESIDRSANDSQITLRDSTGHIKCTLHRDAWSHFAPYIVSEYCALVLNKPTVLTTGSAFKKHYLNITLRNISHIYSNAILNDTEDLPDGFIKIIEDDLTMIKCETQNIGNIFSPRHEVNESDTLGDLEGAFSDVF